MHVAAPAPALPPRAPGKAPAPSNTATLWPTASRSGPPASPPRLVVPRPPGWSTKAQPRRGEEEDFYGIFDEAPRPTPRSSPRKLKSESTTSLSPLESPPGWASPARLPRGHERGGEEKNEAHARIQHFSREPSRQETLEVTVDVFRRRMARRTARRLFRKWRAWVPHSRAEELRQVRHAEAWRRVRCCETHFHRWREQAHRTLVVRSDLRARRHRRILRLSLRGMRAAVLGTRRMLGNFAERKKWRWLGRCWTGWVRWVDHVALEREAALAAYAHEDAKKREAEAMRWADARLVSKAFLGWLAHHLEVRSSTVASKVHALQKQKISALVQRLEVQRLEQERLAELEEAREKAARGKEVDSGPPSLIQAGPVVLEDGRWDPAAPESYDRLSAITEESREGSSSLAASEGQQDHHRCGQGPNPRSPRRSAAAVEAGSRKTPKTSLSTGSPKSGDNPPSSGARRTGGHQSRPSAQERGQAPTRTARTKSSGVPASMEQRATDRKRRREDLKRRQHQQVQSEAEPSATRREPAEVEVLREKRRLAGLHYSRQLLVRRGLGPWKQAVEHARFLWRKAELFHEDTTKAVTFQQWAKLLQWRRHRIEHMYHTVSTRLALSYCASRCRVAFWRWWETVRDLHRLAFQLQDQRNDASRRQCWLRWRGAALLRRRHLVALSEQAAKLQDRRVAKEAMSIWALAFERRKMAALRQRRREDKWRKVRGWLEAEGSS